MVGRDGGRRLHRRRRQIHRSLGGRPRRTSLETAGNRQTGLYHVHLPTLAEEDNIDYDRQSVAMCYLDPPSELSPFVDLASTMALSEREVGTF